MSRRQKLTLIIAIPLVLLLIILALVSIGSQSSIALWLILAVGLTLIGARIYSALPVTAKSVVKTKLPAILAIAAVIIALCFLIPWLKNKITERLAQEPLHQSTSPYSNYPYDHTDPGPCQQVPGRVNKISDQESEVVMNGTESEVDTRLRLEPGEHFVIEQIMFDDYKKNRISYGAGDARPIWGGNDFSGLWPVKYQVGRSGNGVLAIVRAIDQPQEKIFHFRCGQTRLEGFNPSSKKARVILYYNGIIEFRDQNGRLVDVRSRRGWDGSTITVRVWIVNDDGC